MFTLPRLLLKKLPEFPSGAKIHRRTARAGKNVGVELPELKEDSSTDLLLTIRRSFTSSRKPRCLKFGVTS